MIFILVVFSLVLPTILIVLDKKDAKHIKNRKIDNALKQQLITLSKNSNLPFKYWMTRVDDVIEFTQTNNKLVSLLI